MTYTLKFVNDEGDYQKIVKTNIISFIEADNIIENDEHEGGEAILINNETGEEYYYCPDENSNWVKL